MDIAISAVGNMGAAFGAGALVDRMAARFFKKAQQAGQKAGQKLGKDAARWAVIGRSGVIFSTVFSLMWAMPFVRNYIMAKRTGSGALRI
jgi:hypothetical protein